MSPPTADLRRVGVIGCGLMGCGIAGICTRAGLDVVVYEPTADALAARPNLRVGAAAFS